MLSSTASRIRGAGPRGPAPRSTGTFAGRSAGTVPPVHALELQRPILERVAAGEPGAAKECLDRFGGLVWSLARRLCRNATEAEDAVQEIFVDLWKSAPRFDASIASETTFVAMIARRRLIDRTRRRARRPVEATLTEATPVSAAPTDTPPVSEEAALAANAFEQLRPEQKRVLSLAIRNGQSHEQIASTTGLPLGTVKTHARRGLIKLRQILADQGFDFGEAHDRVAADERSGDGATDGTKDRVS
ncbi:MAG: sigma-70 family RNA polymerase sigma factor [Phycisphaerae bacterium]|nr:sigma-70 family RNA polymerase sigma factor [Phycisphaerae bacterium]